MGFVSSKEEILNYVGGSHLFEKKNFVLNNQFYIKLEKNFDSVMNFELFRNKIISKMLSKVSTRANWKPQNTPSRVYHISCLSLLFLSVGDITPCLWPTWPGHSEIKAWRGGCCGVSPFGIPFLFAVNLMISPSEIIHQQAATIHWLTDWRRILWLPASSGWIHAFLFIPDCNRVWMPAKWHRFRIECIELLATHSSMPFHNWISVNQQSAIKVVSGACRS